jgi:hypothetical protein
MLLGKIQSGKTRAFVGVIARSFDRDFDVAVVFTKGTKTLSAQTVARLRHDLQEFIDEDEVLVLDIMAPPGKLTKSEQRRKLVIVAKKQAKNLERIIRFFDEDYPDLKGKRVLIVDDEADLASIRFVHKNNQLKSSKGKLRSRWMLSGVSWVRLPIFRSLPRHTRFTCNPTTTKFPRMRVMFSNRRSLRLQSFCQFTLAMSAVTTIS